VPCRHARKIRRHSWPSAEEAGKRASPLHEEGKTLPADPKHAVRPGEETGRGLAENATIFAAARAPCGNRPYQVSDSLRESSIPGYEILGAQLGRGGGDGVRFTRLSPSPAESLVALKDPRRRPAMKRTPRSVA